MSLIRHKTSVRFAGALAFAVALSFSSLHAQAPARTTNDGVYTAEQATRGQRTFEASCTVCHDTDRFHGSGFIDSWKSEPLFALFETISTQMPADNPGGLKPQEYGDIVAFFLKLNGFATGSAELTGSKDVMSIIKIEPVASH